MTIFPPEIIDAIVDYLHNDKMALIACSLCRDFLPSSRYHLFSEIIIQPRTTDLFILLDLLSSHHGHIAPYARRLVFDNITKFIYCYGVEDVAHAIRNIPRLTSCLPFVKSLRISNTDFEQVPQEITTHLVSHLRHFRDLHLNSLHFYRFSEFVDLVSAFSSLETIYIKRLTWTHNGRTVLSLRRASPKLTWHIKAVRRGGNLSDLAEWLNAHEPIPIVRSLYYDAGCAKEADFIGRLLQRTAPSLRHLQVSFPVFSDSVRVSEMLQDFIDLRPCTGLRSLHFKQILLFPDDAVTTMIRPWVPLLLSQIHSDQLHELIFDLMLPNSGDARCLEEFDWDGVIRVLSLFQFRSLKVLYFIMYPGPSFDAAKGVRYIFDKLPAFRRILRLRFPNRSDDDILMFDRVG